MSRQRQARRGAARGRVVLSQVLACAALDFLLMGLGMAINFVTVVLPHVLDAEEGLSLDKAQASWFGSVAFLCQPLGSVVSGPLLDYFGRKKALFLVNIPHLVAWLLMYAAWDVPSLFVANALLGIGTGIMEAPSITYVGEISEPALRGTLTTLTNCFTSTGMLAAYLLGSVLSWRQAALASLAVPLTAMLLVALVPESPMWLVSQGRPQEALQSLRKLRGWARAEDVQAELDELLQYEARTRAGCGAAELRSALFAKETRRPFGLVMAYFFFHILSGLAPVRPNMVNVCRALGMKYEPKHIVVAVGVVFIAMNILSAAIVKLTGKRKLVVGSLLATACCSLALGAYARARLPAHVFSYEPATFPAPRELLPVLLFMLLVAFSSLGIPWVLLSEVFPFRGRGLVTGLAAALSYALFFAATKSNYNVEAYLHLSGAFCLYGALGLVGAVYLYFFLPETENKSLVEIEAYYKGDRKVFADDFLINAFRKKQLGADADEPMLAK